MRPTIRLLLAPITILLVALALPACGDDDGGDDGGGATTGSAATGSGIPEQFAPELAPPDDAKQGGHLEVIASSDVDYMDPGAAYYQFTYMITGATLRGLLSWDPDDVQEPTPDLAAEQPEISADSKTVTFKIRPGVKFAPPVNREVTAADVEYAIERTVLPGVYNGYADSYLGGVVGWADAAKQAQKDPTGGAPDIPGITAVDDETLEIKLDTPTGFIVTQALSLPMSVPVPEEYAKKFDAKNPSEYGNYVVATGPYMIRNDPETGELVGYTPGKEIDLVRNPNWDPETDFRPAFLDSIKVREGFNDTASATKQIMNGESQVNGDFVPPPTALKDAAENYEQGQLVITPSGGNRYIALNTQEPPFDDINIRKAVVAISDREALRNTRGGPLIGPVAQHYIPPGASGFEEAGGLEGTGLDFMANINGDPAVADKYMKAAGFESGKCEGSECTVTMVSDDVSPGKDTAEVFKGQLEELGFKVEWRPVDHDIMYTRFCSVPEQAPDICPNVGWLKDFYDSQSLFQITFAGNAIDPSNNSNWPQLDDPAINDAIAEGALINNPDDRAQHWGDVDTMVTESAAAVPWVWDNQPNMRSANVAGVIHLFNANWDLSYTSLR